ncbi:MAG: type II toxin-antitoxin system HicA family toxin [Bacteroidetes bacterium]|nr:type II toxin-antitoxin system HicA family toxin [Bacteroidota bacterium]
MTKLPRISGRECVKALKRVGFYFKRQEGSHIILRKDNPFCQVVVPDHKELDRGTLRGIIRGANLGVDEFISLSQICH